MSLRTQNCLKRAGIHTLGDLVQRTMRDIMNVRGLGQAGLFDIEEVLKTYGLQFRRNIKT
jgi:DNA-directed RNA polymerase subunit alpha